MDTVSKLEGFVVTFMQEEIGLAAEYSKYIYLLIALLIILTSGWVANYVVKKFLLTALRSLASKTNTKIAKYLLEESFFLRLSHLAPAFVISSLSQLVFSEYEVLNGVIEVLINLYLVGIALWVFDSLIDTFTNFTKRVSFPQNSLLKGYVRQLK